MAPDSEVRASGDGATVDGLRDRAKSASQCVSWDSFHSQFLQRRERVTDSGQQFAIVICSGETVVETDAPISVRIGNIDIHFASVAALKADGAAGAWFPFLDLCGIARHHDLQPERRVLRHVNQRRQERRAIFTTHYPRADRRQQNVAHVWLIITPLSHDTYAGIAVHPQITRCHFGALRQFRPVVRRRDPK